MAQFSRQAALACIYSVIGSFSIGGMMSTATVLAPTKLEELGVRRSVLEDLALKIVYLHGEMGLGELAAAMKLGRSVTEEVFQRLRKDQMVEITGLIGTVHRFQTSSGGKARALELLAINQYTGPAPVSLAAYSEMVRNQSVAAMHIHPSEMERGFRHLVVDKTLLTQLGTAVNSGRAIFLYGPTGTGKTTIAETLARISHAADILIPYAVEIDGQIITVFDEHLHRRSSDPDDQQADGRWVKCRRPRVLVGGELSSEMLDLEFNQVTKFYTAPVQMKANNGLLILDDFGRQRIAPTQLLNRWVVPLDRHIDFLGLVGGKKVEIPFDVMVVFATNLDPAQLADEAFLRRIQTKIHIGYMTEEQFRAIFRNICSEYGLQYDDNLVTRLISDLQDIYNQPLRACYPRDIVQQVCWAAKYQGREASLSAESVRAACNAYFIQSANGYSKLASH